jgi:hypothetical protein
MILKQTIQRGRRERRSRGVLLLVRRAAEATENKAGRLFQYHAGKKKRPPTPRGVEDVVVRDNVSRVIWRLHCLRMRAENNTGANGVSNLARRIARGNGGHQYFRSMAGGCFQRA